MIVKNLDGYWMCRVSIDEAAVKKPEDELPVEIFIAGPPTADDDNVEGILLTTFSAFIQLRAALNEEFERWQDSIELGRQDIA